MDVLLLGGVGGHSGQAYALAQFLRACEIPFDVLTYPGTEARFRGLARKVLVTPQILEPVTRRFNATNLLIVIKKLLTLKKYKVVIANGSNFGVPPSLWEKMLGAKLVNVEMLDAVVKPTKAAKFLHRFADVTFVQWDELLPHYPGAKVSGPIFEPPEYEPREGDYILVTAGTYGYEELFEAAARSFGKEVVLQTGRVDPSKYKGMVREAFTFDPDFHRWLANARAVIGVFPGTTPAIARLAYCKPVVVVPNPKLPHSTPPENMKPFVEKIGAVIGDLGNLEDSLSEALRKECPRYENGALRVVEEVLGLI